MRDNYRRLDFDKAATEVQRENLLHNITQNFVQSGEIWSGNNLSIAVKTGRVIQYMVFLSEWKTSTFATDAKIKREEMLIIFELNFQIC